MPYHHHWKNTLNGKKVFHIYWLCHTINYKQFTFVVKDACPKWLIICSFVRNLGSIQSRRTPQMNIGIVFLTRRDYRATQSISHSFHLTDLQTAASTVSKDLNSQCAMKSDNFTLYTLKVGKTSMKSEHNYTHINTITRNNFICHWNNTFTADTRCYKVIKLGNKKNQETGMFKIYVLEMVKVMKL